MGFTKAQYEALTHDTGPALVLAGPGAGKTHVVTHRTKYLIQSRGLDPGRLLVITFTRAAAGEMALRFQNINNGKKLPVWFYTFHSFCFKVLSHAYNLDFSNILKDDIKFNLMRELISSVVVNHKNEVDFISDILSEISFLKNQGTNLADYQSKTLDKEEFDAIFTAYQKKLRDNRLVDFDDMLMLTNELFVKRPDYLKKWVDRFDRITVDEAQDMNGLQYRLLTLLAGEKENTFLVGDDDQAIYSFRGADPKVLKGYVCDFGDVRIYNLLENHRSRKEIVDCAGKVIEKAKDRFEKKIISVRGEGGKLEFYCYENRYEEYRHIGERISEILGSGAKPLDIAVLFRTNRQMGLLNSILFDMGIPCISSGRQKSMFEREHMLDVLSYINMSVADHVWRSDLLRVMNKPLRYISRDALKSEVVTEDGLLAFYEGKKWMQEAVESLFGELAMIEKLNSFAAVNFIRKGVGYDEWLRERSKERGVSFEDIACDLDTLSDIAREFPDKSRFLAEIERLKGCDDKPEITGDAVTIMTMHASKGLEFPVVFLPDVTEGQIPYKKAVLGSEIDAERRLFYVAITRAKDDLYICYEKGNASHFLSPFEEVITIS